MGLLAVGEQVAMAEMLPYWTVSRVLRSLVKLGRKEVRVKGKFTVPGLVMIRTRNKPAKPAHMKAMFGKMRMCKARPAKTIVKAFPVAALTAAIVEATVPPS